MRVVVLTGAGEKAFVSGADISQFEKNRSNAEAQREYDRLTSGGRKKLGAFAKPTIARIRGFCLGGGLAIAMQADIRIAAEGSQFGIPAARLGIAYGFRRAEQARPPRRAGARADDPLHRAAHRRARGRADRAGQQDRAGCRTRAAVTAIARSIAENAPLSVYASKITINDVTEEPADRNPEAVARATAACFDSEDYREGRTAFLEKRRPNFRGR